MELNGLFCADVVVVVVVVVAVVVVTRSDQPKPPAVAIVRQNGLSSASCRASVATPTSRQIWWIQVVGADVPLRNSLTHSNNCNFPTKLLIPGN